MTKSFVSRRITCRLCDRSHLEWVLPLAATRVADKYVTREQVAAPTDRFPLDLYLCLDCGHVQRLDVVAPNFLFQDFTYVSAGSPLLPYGIYTIPEVSKVGEIGDKDGFLTLLVRRENRQLLGVHALGEQATELIRLGLMEMQDGSFLIVFTETCFNVPKLSALYKTAALDALRQIGDTELGVSSLFDQTLSLTKESLNEIYKSRPLPIPAAPAVQLVNRKSEIGQ